MSVTDPSNPTSREARPGRIQPNDTTLLFLFRFEGANKQHIIQRKEIPLLSCQRQQLRKDGRDRERRLLTYVAVLPFKRGTIASKCLTDYTTLMRPVDISQRAFSKDVQPFIRAGKLLLDSKSKPSQNKTPSLSFLLLCLPSTFSSPSSYHHLISP